MSSYYGTVDISAGVEAKAEIPATGLSGAIIGNESGLTVKVTLQGANSSRSLYPGTVDFFEIPKGSSFNGNLIFSPEANLSNASDWPASYIQVDVLGPNERPNGQYPITLVRQSGVNGSVSVSNATSVTNAGYASGTIFISSQVSGEAVGENPVKITNDGTATFGDGNFVGLVDVTASLDYQVELNGQGKITGKLSSSTLEFALLGSNEGTYGQSELDLYDTNQNQTITIVGNGTVTITGDSALTLGKSGGATPGTLTIYNDKSGSDFVVATTGDVTISGAIDSEPADMINTGSVTGTITVWQDMSGKRKVVMAYMNNWQSANAATFTLPTPFTDGALVWAGGIGTGNVLSFTDGGGAISMRVITSLATAGGGTSAVSEINEDSFGEILAPFNSITFAANTSAHTGFVKIEGR